MPLSANNPRDLFLVLLADLLFVERQLSFEVIPELLSKVKDPELSGALGNHLEETKRHAETLEEVFGLVAAEPSPNHSDPFEGLVEQHSQIGGSVLDDTVADVFHAASAAHAEHYEIGAYRALIALAEAMERGDAVKLLERNLEDEDRALAEVEGAVERLSRNAVAAGEPGGAG